MSNDFNTSAVINCLSVSVSIHGLALDPVKREREKGKYNKNICVGEKKIVTIKDYE